MLRTTIIRSNLLKETTKKLIRNNVARITTVECSKRRYHNRKITVLRTEPQRWHDKTVRYYSSNLPSHSKVLLPALSPTMETGNIVSWAKKEGDKLNEGDLLAEIETDKATMGFETPEEGFLAKILISSGTKGVPIGKLVCIIVQNQSDVAAFKDFKDDSVVPPKVAAAPSVAPPAPSVAVSPPSPAPAAPFPIPPPQAGTPPDAGGRVYASPMARRLAEQRNIRLQGKGTGLYDSITSGDLDTLAVGAVAAVAPAVDKSARRPAPRARPTVPAGSAYIDIPITNMRSIIAKRLLQSKLTVPHYYESIDVAADNLLKLRKKYNKKLEKKDIRLSVNDFIVKAAALALVKVPEVNSQWLDSVIRQYRHADISIAVATDNGLITPIVFEAERKGVTELNEEIKELAERAREGSLLPHEFQGGTFTISNLGMFGIAHFTAIINPPQSCILAVGTTRNRLVVDEQSEKGFRNEQYMTLTLSSDHRIVDGALAAKWLQVLKEYLEEPESMIM